MFALSTTNPRESSNKGKCVRAKVFFPGPPEVFVGYPSPYRPKVKRYSRSALEFYKHKKFRLANATWQLDNSESVLNYYYSRIPLRNPLCSSVTDSGTADNQDQNWIHAKASVDHDLQKNDREAECGAYCKHKIEELMLSHQTHKRNVAILKHNLKEWLEAEEFEKSKRGQTEM